MELGRWLLLVVLWLLRLLILRLLGLLLLILGLLLLGLRIVRTLLWSTLLGSTVLAARRLRFLVCGVLWSSGGFSVESGMQVVRFLQCWWQWWWSWKMITDRLESVSIGLVLNAVELTVGCGVGVTARDNLFRFLRA